MDKEIINKEIIDEYILKTDELLEKYTKLDVAILKQTLFQKVDYVKKLAELNFLIDKTNEMNEETYELLENDNNEFHKGSRDLVFNINHLTYELEILLIALSDIVNILLSRSNGEKTSYDEYKNILQTYNDKKSDFESFYLNDYYKSKASQINNGFDFYKEEEIIRSNFQQLIEINNYFLSSDVQKTGKISSLIEYVRFSSYYNALIELHSNLLHINENYKNINISNLCIDNTNKMKCVKLFNYSENLLLSTDKLLEIFIKLDEDYKGIKYSYFKYIKDMRSYNKSCRYLVNK